MSLTVAYLGNFREDMPESERFTTECHVAASLSALGGVRVIQLQENKVTLPDILNACRESDLFLWTRTGGWLRCNGFEMLQRIKIPTAAYHLDLFWGLDRETELSFDPYWSVDYSFTADGGHQDDFKKAGVNHFWLNPGVLKRECYVAEPRQDLICDVGFIGSYNYHSQHDRKGLIDFLKSAYGSRFRLFGANGDSWRGNDLNQLYRSIRCVVGDSCFAGRCKKYVSDRFYESCGRGAMTIFPVIEGITDEFTEGVHLRLYQFGDYEGLRGTIDEILALSEAQRLSMRQAASAYVKSRHTYTERMQQLLETVAAHEPAIAERLAE